MNAWKFNDTKLFQHAVESTSCRVTAFNASVISSIAKWRIPVTELLIVGRT